MKGWTRSLAGMASFLVVFFVVRSFVDERGPQRVAPAAPDVSAAAPGSTPRLAAQSPSDDSEIRKQNEAADAFWGFYFVNTRGRQALCLEHGVDVQRFVDAFERAHATEYANAKAVYRRSGSSEEAVYATLKPSLNAIVLQDMRGISADKMADACRLIAADAEALAADMHLSKLRPAVFEVLETVR